ncbi:MAG: PP2C family protein-serine/threonine phosphatase [Phycisphaerae bacterium]|nr:PP2C family protein-serine/threonine phosphatase [Phycisphaerae bacterium]
MNHAGTTEHELDIALAAEIQAGLLPKACPHDCPNHVAAARNRMCAGVGGDFYDFIRLPSNNLGVGICDVVGKGVRASLLMASIRASLRAHAVNVYEMSDVLEKVNSDFCADTQISDFATLFYAVLDARERRFTYANAGHIPPLLIRDGQIRQLSTGGGVLGVDPHGHWDHESFTLCSGDVIFAYTDGLSEAINFDDEAFGSERVEATVLEAVATGQCAEGVAKHVLWQMRRFAGLQKRFDDLTLLAIRVL